ncbi:hypothetical protein K7X08_020949 [Anisodus acutangulus]|uniref:RING-type E3 ubiquitin transferase n=1 Tax=Anisodus acutangulus TaxID=402998 RepID=A0A9Q1RQG8_9SOLA|nr:hypothetical protein K7X08_020949 [Anisodus acutangulus]
MVPVNSSVTWAPHMSKRDCSQGFCSLYCPQWCYIIFPPPPPFDFPADDDDSGPNFSPLVIGIIGILVSAFLLVSYYVIMSKCCGHKIALRRRENHLNDSELEENDPSNHDAWHVNTTVFVNASPLPTLSPPIIEAITPLMNERTSENQPENDIEMGVREEDEEVEESRVPPKRLITENMNLQIRRSVSMDQVPRGVLSTVDILKIDHDEDIGTSKQEVGEEEVSTLQHCVSSSMGIKRSFSSGRFMFPKLGRGQNIIIPL